MKLQEDLGYIYIACNKEFNEFKGKTLFITGGTGFFGKWLIESLIYANDTGDLSLKIIILSRYPEVFLNNYPHFRKNYIRIITGDICNFSYPEEPIDFIFHMATEASVDLNLKSPLYMFDVVVKGTRYVFDLAVQKKVKAILLTSSGAVYGQQPQDLDKIPEEYTGSPNVFNANAAYSEGKRVAEMLSSFYYKQYGLNVKIARCFAFVGPYLPLNTHFAVGNFIKNLLEIKDITINGDGTPYRSYMYGSDLIIWLIKILLNAQSCDPVNVGSDEYLTIKELAEKVLKLYPSDGHKINIMQKEPSKIIFRYVPSIDKAKKMLNLSLSVNLDEALKKTILYHQNVN